MRKSALALFLVSLGLRPQLVVIGPLLPLLRRDLGLDHTIAGLLAAIPVLCMGVFALAGPSLGRRLGLERAVALGVAAIVIFGVARSLAPDVLLLLATTFAIGVGIAVVGPLLPTIVHERLPNRAVLATGVYAGGISIGTSVAAAVAVPLAESGGSWRAPMLVISVLTGATLVLWLVLGRRAATPTVGSTEQEHHRLPWRHRRAWGLAVVFGMQSVLFYAAVAWLPSIYVERGWTESDAGFLVALMNGVGLISTFGAPALAERFGSRREHLLVASTIAFAGFVGVAVAPDLAVVWVALLGLGIGGVFPLTLTLPVDLARQTREVAGLAAIMLFGGYGVSAVGPFALGLVRDATGSFAASEWLLVIVAALLIAACMLIIPAGLARASGARRVRQSPSP